MMSVKRFIFELVTPPIRPRYQDRFMYVRFMKDDADMQRLRESQFAAWLRLRGRNPGTPH